MKYIIEGCANANWQHTGQKALHIQFKGAQHPQNMSQCLIYSVFTNNAFLMIL